MVLRAPLTSNGDLCEQHLAFHEAQIIVIDQVGLQNFLQSHCMLGAGR